MPKDGPSIVSNSTAATFGNSPQKTGEPVNRLSIYSGKALEFDGVGDYITSNPDFAVNASAATAMTVAVWVNVDDISSNQDVIMAFDTVASSRFLGNYSGAIIISMYNQDYSDVIGQKTDDVVLVEGQWHRIVVTYDGSQTDAGFKIYMDGALMASTATNSAFSANINNSLVLGRTDRPSSTADFAGKMCNFQLWDTVWSLADVTYDYLNPEKLITSQNPTDDLVSNLRVWYPMNDTGVVNPQTVIFDAANSGGLTSNYVSSSSFDSDSGWSLGTNWSISGGKLIGSSNAANANLTGLGFEANFIYKVVYSITSYTSGEVRVTVAGGQSGTYRSGVGTYTEYLPAGSTGGNLTFRGNPSSAFTGEIDDLTVQKVKQGYHGTTTFLGDDKLGGNGGFDATSNWTVVSGSVGTEWTINDSSNSKAVHNTSNANTLRYTGSSGDLVDGTTYQVDFTIADRTAGSITIAIGGAAASSSQTASGSIELTAGGSSNRIIDINPTSDFDGSIDSVTVKEVGIATGWTDADQQQYIPQTGFMDGCVKSIFNGSSTYVDFGSATALDDVFVGGATVSFWVYLDLDNDPSSNGGLINKIGNGNQGWQIYLDTFSSSKYEMRFAQKWNNKNLIQTSQVIRSQRWNHIVITYDASSNSNRATFYLNGSVQTFDVLSTDYNASDSTSITSDASDNLEIGRKSTGGIYQNMIMDDISIFSTELTLDQVIELYNNAVPLNATESAATSNLIGYWKNNVLSSAGTWEDLSTNDNHGTPNNLDDYIYFQQGVTANLCTQSYSTNIVHPSKGAAYFDGVNSYGNASRGVTIDDIWRSSATVEFWIKPFTATAADRVIDKKPVGHNGWYISLEDVSGAACDIQLRCDATTSDSIQITASREIALHQWNYVAIVYDGSATSNTATIYVGGGSSNAKPTSKTVTSTNPGAVPLTTDASNDLAIGGRSGTETANSFDGLIDDVKIYNKALSLTELTKNFNNNKSQHKN